MKIGWLVLALVVGSACGSRAAAGPSPSPSAAPLEFAPFTGKVIVLRATSQTTFASAAQGDLIAIGRFALKPDDGFTLSFDSRPYVDGSYPLNFMNR